MIPEDTIGMINEPVSRKKKICSGSVSFIDITVQVDLSMDVPITYYSCLAMNA
jgi:hypothetical protein